MERKLIREVNSFLREERAKGDSLYRKYLDQKELAEYRLVTRICAVAVVIAIAAFTIYQISNRPSLEDRIRFYSRELSTTCLEESSKLIPEECDRLRIYYTQQLENAKAELALTPIVK